MRTNRKEVFFRKAFSLLLVLFAVLTVRAEVRLPRLISDGMILQRDTNVKVWGWASANEKIEVKFAGKVYSTVTAQNGKWEVTLPPQPAGGPYDISVNDITIKDVLFGDVWVCSGQSNMELPIRRVLDLYADEVKSVNNPYIRQFNVPLKYDFEQPREDVENASWKAVTPENILDYSAVAYFFAKDLYEKYGVPIGLIKSAVGGSPVEAWISEDHLKHFPPYLAVAKECAVDGYIEGIRNAENRASYEWYSELESKDEGISRWNKANFNDSDWGTVYLPGYWEDQGVTKSKGSFWFRKDFEVSETMAGKSAVLRLGCIVDADSAFVNGHFVGNITYQYPPRIYNIPEGILKKGKNNVTVRVVNSGGKGGFVEDKPYRIISGDEYVDLTGAWKYKIGAEMRPGPAQTFFQYKPMGLYNGMIAPLKDYAIKGVIWYQGESNTGRLDDYRSLFPALISDWREKWDMPDMPFLHVQLPNFMETREQPSDGGWARFREVQRQNLTIPNTAMAVTIDLGEWNDIHPLNKKDIGHRLALAAMKTAYGDTKVVGTGPIYKGISARGNKIVVSFDVEGKGIAMGEELKGFAIAGEDGQFVWAKARVEGNNVVVWNDNIANPVAVRYAWADNPTGANLRNKEGLPASPFQAKLLNDNAITENETGIHAGFDYELWRDTGDVDMILNTGGTFECNWKNINNVLFRTGKKFDSTKTHNEIGAISLTYGCDYKPNGNSYLCVYGWSVDPLVEFYVVEAWGSWRPPGAEPKGTVEIDGGTYEIYETTRVEQPSIQGNTTFQQYWSVRTDRKTAGTISVSKHIEAWEKMGMKLGKMYEVALCVEGFRSSGSANIYDYTLTVGDTTIGK